MNIADRNPASILIVDDNLDNLKLLGRILQENDYNIAIAKNGHTAIDILSCTHIDLILLDIMMPGMDGFEVCRKIKSTENMHDIPVIFLTAKTESEDVVKAFKAGGVDYITKPFHKEELLIRVKTHIELQQSKETIRKQTAELQEIINTRDKLYSIIAHDLRSPVHAIQTIINYLIDNKDGNQIKCSDELMLIKQSIDPLYVLLENLLLWSSNQQGKIAFNPDFFTLFDLINPGLVILGNIAAQKKISIISNYDNQISVYVDFNMLSAVYRNLISNAIKFTPENGRIEINSEKETETIKVLIKDNGIGIKEEILSKIFEENAGISCPGTNNEKGHGFGLAMCKDFMEKHGGKLRVESQPEKGSTFIVELPVIKKKID